MKLCSFVLSLFSVLCASAVNCFSVDREAFTFTKYDLDVRIEPDQHRLGARGTITLRNDSASPQKIASLQISSSLDWRSIKAGGKPLQFVSQPYSSDIDHTGVLCEAVATLPEAIPPKGTVDLEIAYEGVIVLDATRLTRIGTPDAAANSSDWDQISPKFTAVRGVGYVAWYPIATDAASLSQGAELSEVVGRWKNREAASTMRLHIVVPGDTKDEAEDEPPELLVNATACPSAHEVEHQFEADCWYHSFGLAVPTFVIADFETADQSALQVHYLRGHNSAATGYADAAEKVRPLITEWFGAVRSKAQTVDLTDPDAVAFESGSLLLIPLSSIDPKLAGLIAAHQLTHAAFSSPRPWINEGLAHFAQALYLEHQSGRQSALDYMAQHRSALSAAEGDKEKPAAPAETGAERSSLITSTDEALLRSKAMCVWWMLRDMIGDQALKKALAAYQSDQDKEPSYLQRLIQAQTQRDLEWFFDDWVYRDRGLPDFRVASAYTRKTLPEGYMVTITVENIGTAGAEVPLTVKFAGGEIAKRLVVRGKSNAVIRIEIPQAPEEIVINDGSVPESDTANNTFKIQAVTAP
ncbi:MAG: M1 family aminopeptidase [Candidatus Sulfotelmatobacter sp.]